MWVVSLPFIHFWDLCFWQRAALSWRGPFVPPPERCTGPQSVCACNNHDCEAAPSPYSHACSRQPPTQVTWATGAPVNLTLWDPSSHGAPSEAHTLTCHVTSLGLCGGDNPDWSLQGLHTALLDNTAEIKFIITSADMHPSLNSGNTNPIKLTSLYLDVKQSPAGILLSLAFIKNMTTRIHIMSCAILYSTILKQL